MKVLILYYTRTGHTLEAAQAAAEGIRSAGSEAALIPLNEFEAADLTAADALIVGSPCWAGSMTPMGIALPMYRALKDLPETAASGKRCGGISVHAGMGGETTVATIGKVLAQKGCTDYLPGPAARAGSPLSLWTGPEVSPEDLARFRAYGAAFVGT